MQDQNKSWKFFDSSFPVTIKKREKDSAELKKEIGAEKNFIQLYKYFTENKKF